MNSGLSAVDCIEADQGVDFKVGKVKIDINGVEADQEVYKGLAFFGRNKFQEGGCNSGAIGEWCVDRDLQDESLSINIADVYTTFVGEKDVVALACRVNADIVFGVRRVW